MLSGRGLCLVGWRLLGRSMVLVSVRRVQQPVTRRFQGRSTVGDRTVAGTPGILRVIVLPASRGHFMVPVVPVVMVMVVVMVVTPRRWRRRGRRRLEVHTDTGYPCFICASTLQRRRQIGTFLVAEPCRSAYGRGLCLGGNGFFLSWLGCLLVVHSAAACRLCILFQRLELC